MANNATPTDAPPKPKKLKTTKGKSVPSRGIRRRVLGQGEGDHCVYAMAPADSDLPDGSLIPIPNVPRFPSAVEAIRWIRNDSGDLLAGMQVMVFMAKEVIDINVVQQPVVHIVMKPKVVVNDPTEESV